MKRQKWVDKNFQFELSSDKYNLVLKKLSENSDIIARLVSGLPEDILTKKINNHWSIKENVGHLIDLEQVHDGRIDDFIAGKDILRPADMNNTKTNEANHNIKKNDDLIEQFKSVRENFVKRLKSLDVNILSRSAKHPRLNQPMRPIDMAQFVLEHDEHHIQTIKEIISDNQ